MPRMTGEYNRALILQVIGNAEDAIDAIDIADVVRLAPNTVKTHLTQLARNGLVAREKVQIGGRGVWRYVYTSNGAQVILEEESDDVFWEPVREAVARARPKWRIGERSWPASPLDGFEERRDAWMGRH